MKLLFTFFLTHLAFSLAWAQVPGILPDSKLIPEFSKEMLRQKTPVSEATPAYTESEVKALALELDQQFQNALKPLQSQSPKCSDTTAPAYTLALQVAGRLDECAAYANSCLKSQESIQPQLLTYAALCESTRFRSREAISFFEAGLKSKWSKDVQKQEHVFQYSIFLLSNGFEANVDSVIAQYPGASEKDQKFVKGVIKRFLVSGLGDLKKDEVDKYHEQLIKSASGPFKSLLQAIQARILRRDYKYAQALASIFQNAKTYGNPLLWYDVAAETFYYGLDQKYEWSRHLYDAYDRYSYKWLNFPSENNTYNYTQIYGSVCKDQVTQGSQKVQLDDIKSLIRSGKMDPSTALRQVVDFEKSNPGKADVLVLKANLLSLTGNPEASMDTYWQAHKLCRYFNRANWGMTLAKRYFKYLQMPDYNDNLKRVDARLEKVTVPQEISQYFLNWSSLDMESKRRVTYGSWFFMPYLPKFVEYGKRTYIKYAFDLLSESPGLSDIRDVRIGGVNYPNDNRLWDDVRGLGGNPVVADIAEVFQTPQGDYNLLSHEMAHQFQFLMDDAYPAGVTCIEDLYQEALAKKNFPDGYSAYNKEEHFAQGVTYYLVPPDAATHFGLNQNWVKENNLRQFNFVQSIENSNGHFEKLNCQKID